MFVLGLNIFHGDSSACILKDGVMIAAAEEERFVRIKHWAGFPKMSIDWCLSEAQISIAEVDHIAINQDPKANLTKKLIYLFKNPPNLDMLIGRIQNKIERLNLKKYFEKEFPNASFKGSFHSIEHHTCHLSSAFHVSPYDNAAILSIDGFGDFASTTWGYGKGIDINIDDRVYFPHSLGIFYMMITQFLGFSNWGDEYKVMGLAPYGKPTYLKHMRKLVKLKPKGKFELNLKYFCHHREKTEQLWSNDTPLVKNLFTVEIEKLLGISRKSGNELTQRHKDIAHSAQIIYEEAFFHILNYIYHKFKLTSLAIAGGCAFNSVANGKVLLKTPFKKLYVQSAAGDAGGAIGAAFNVWHKIGGKKASKRGLPHDHAYWGPKFNDEYLKDLIESEQEKLKNKNCSILKYTNLNDLIKKTATEITDGKVIGWFQGRMEWGPRALGNRSIICDPRRKDMKDILNLKIKRRESFRPFAPSILHEKVSEWFEQAADVPFMMQVYQIKKDKRSKIPAVTHVDGSGRLQSVYKHTNPRYYKLIEEFNNLTGIPLILNTSFNENEPVVCKPEEALNTFLRTNMDMLVIGDWIIERP